MTAAARSLELLLARLEQPVTMSHFLGVAEMAQMLLSERNETADTLRAALQADPVAVAYQYHGALTLAAEADDFMRNEGTPLYYTAPPTDALPADRAADLDAALVAYNRADFQWPDRSAADVDVPRHRYAMRAALLAAASKPTGERPAKCEQSWNVGDRVLWTCDLGKQYAGTIAGVRPTAYTAELDDGWDAEGYPADRFAALQSQDSPT